MALLANINVDKVSPKYNLLLCIVANNLVIELPANESLRKWVNLESLKGTCFCFFNLVLSTNALITLANTWSDLFILQPYFNL